MSGGQGVEIGIPQQEHSCNVCIECYDKAQATKHRDALADTHDAYTAFHGWVLQCSWCEFEAVGKTKTEALRHMQRHYDRVLPEGADIR